MNTSVRYERQWEDMLLTVHLYTKDADSKKDIYLTTLQRKAADFNMYEVKKTKIKVKNFDTYAVEGIMPDGTRGLLVNLVSKKSELVVQIVVNYLFGNREAVEEVVKSFAENPDRKPNHETRYTNKRTGAQLKHPVDEVVLENALHIDTEFDDENGSWRNCKLESELCEMGLTFTKADILKAVNYISADNYTEIEIVDR